MYPNSVLRAGAVELQLAGGMLRYIKYNGIEAVRGIYAAVRDKNWGTVAPRISSLDIADHGRDGFRVNFFSEHQDGGIDFVWEGLIEGASDGTIKYSMDGEARTSFLKNRIGFCILHPIHLAGQPVHITTETGEEYGYFPERIAPQDPFLNITAMRHAVAPGVDLELSFEGDLFEMEDQRNWTDASYKTFCTPLALPFPVEIKRNERVHQSVTLVFRPTEGNASILNDIPATAAETILRVSSQSAGKLPPIGLGAAPLAREHTDLELQQLRKLHCSHYHLKLELESEDWKKQVRYAYQACTALEALLELEVIADRGGALLEPLFAYLASEAIRPARIKVYPKGTYVTPQDMVTKSAALCREYGLKASIGCGTRANFAEFNRAGMPLEGADYAFYSINAQTHAFDDASVTETLEAQPATAESAKAIVGNVPLHIGPITLKPRVNPVAATPEAAEAAESSSNQADKRLYSLYGAGWTIGSAHNLALASSAALTYHEHLGDLGIMEAGGGRLHPVFHVLADIGEFAGAELLVTEITNRLRLTAIALRQDLRVRVLAANMTGEAIALRLVLPSLQEASIRTLGESSAAAASLSRASLLASAVPIELSDEPIVSLQPYAIVCLDAFAAEPLG